MTIQRQAPATSAVPAEERDLAEGAGACDEAGMRRQSDYGVVAIWAALIGLLIMTLCFVRVPLG